MACRKWDVLGWTLSYAICQLLTCEVVLNTFPPGETDEGRTHYPSYVIRKWTMDGQRQTGQIGYPGIGGDNIGLIGTPLI